MLIYTIFLWGLCALVTGKEYSITLDPLDKFNVSWSIEETTPTSKVTFTVTCKTTGWVGIGFSPNGAMTGADIIMAWVTDDGKGHLLDMYAEANGAPVEDTSQDVQLISATESNGITTIVFSRSLDTCDKEQDNVILSSTTRLIYAYKDSDPKDNSVSSSDYHGSSTRGVRSVYLLEPSIPVPDLPDDVVTYDMVVNNYSVPATDTTYYCSFFNPPPLDTKHHVVSIDVLITPGNEGLVHHILLYGCWGLDKEHIRNNNKTEGICFTSEMPEFEGSCRSVVHGWAIGGGGFNYPEVAGFPIGGNDGAAPDYYMMETHYDNPSLSTGKRDSSGFRLTYTPTLRSMDVGFLQLGVVGGIVVPPQPDQFRTVAYCDSSCTNQWIPDEGVKVFNYVLHAHLLGVGIRVDWFRNGEYLGVLAEDDAYDFNFQESRNLEKPKVFLPGDALKITCTYSDPSREGVTYGGLSSKEEMCLAFLSYYPKQNISNCESLPGLLVNPSDPVYSDLSLNATRHGSRYSNVRIFSTVDDWSEEAVSSLQKSVEESDQFSLCYEFSDSPYALNFQPINSSNHVVMEEEEPDFCDNHNHGEDNSHNHGGDNSHDHDNHDDENEEDSNNDADDFSKASQQIFSSSTFILIAVAAFLC